MKGEESDSFNISNLRIVSKHISLEKMKKSKNFRNETKGKLDHNFKNSENDFQKNKKYLNLYIINSQLQKHNSNPLKKGIMIINDVIDTKTNHYLAVFKDYLISDYIDEFLKRYFKVKESKELLPKFYEYYQNYLKFFCRGIFIDFKANQIIQEYGECQAEFYYNRNYGSKNKKSKKNKNSDNNNQNSIQNSSNYDNNENIKIKKIFTDTVKNSLNKIERSKLIQYYLFKFKTNEISNIFYKNKNETITLNDNTKILSDDNLLTNENSIINLIDIMIHKKKEKNKVNKNKNKNKKINNNIDDKNIVNIYKNLLEQSPIRSERIINHNNKNGIYSNKINKKISSINNYNKNIPITIGNNKKNSNSNISNEYTKTPVVFDTQKILNKNNISRNIKNNNNNNSNLFIKNNLTQRGHYKHISKSISSRIGGYINTNNLPQKNTTKNKKFSSFHTNSNLFNQNNQNSKQTLKINGLYHRTNDSNYLLSNSSSRNLKNNVIYSLHTNNNNNIINSSNNNNQKLNKRIKYYHYLQKKNKNSNPNPNQNQLKNRNIKTKQNNSLTSMNSIFNNFSINISNNIMLLNNNNNHNHNAHHSNKNNIKSNSKNKKILDDMSLKLNMTKRKKSRNNTDGVDFKKYKTEIRNIQSNLKNKKNMCSSLRKYIYLVKNKIKDKTNSKNKEMVIKHKNRSNIFNNHSCFKIKNYDDSDNIPSVKNIKQLNNSNKNMNLNKADKIKIIFDYKRK